MNRLVWFAGILLAVSFVFPNGISLPLPAPSPAPVPVPEPAAETDAKIVELLADADPADKARIDGMYTAMATILTRDDGKLINTTEKWAEYQSRTLTLAVDQPGKYPGLDVAIENVFMTVLGTDDVLPNNGETQMKLIRAAKIIAASARK